MWLYLVWSLFCVHKLLFLFKNLWRCSTGYNRVCNNQYFVFVFVFYSLVKDQNIPGKKEINNQSCLLAVILFHRFLPHPTPKIETETERVCVARSVHTHVVMYVIVVDLFCIVLFSILKQTPCTLVIYNISCNFLNESHWLSDCCKL